MSSKRKREKEDSAKQKRNKKVRTATPAKGAEATDDPSPMGDTSLVVSDGNSGQTSNLAANGHNELTDNEMNHSEQQWKIRDSVGGRLLDLNPVFSTDGRYYILAYSSGVKVFSCETSLLVRSLPCAIEAQVIAIAISPSDPSSLIVGLANGQIERWAWLDGLRTAGFDIDSSIHALAVATLPDANPMEDKVFVSYHSKKAWHVAAYTFGNDDPGEQEENSPTLLSSETCITSLQICDNGHFLVASDGQRIIIGRKQTPKDSSLRSLNYSWREFNCTHAISTIKARSLPLGSANHPSVLDLAVGTREGIIYLYRNVIGQMDTTKIAHHPPSAIRLHWHRRAVATVDWSRDGNYLISGGEETVLVLWQLNSNQKSFLPHLTAPILRAVVSPSGESYGVTLADNSSMVLRALTLEPETSISEPQLFLKDAVSISPRLASKPQKSTATPSNRWRIPVSVAESSSRLLYATFASQTPRETGRSNILSPFLHTYDYRSGAQISKQALARTLVTDHKVGPRGEKIHEPKVVLLQISADEKWLATVDEWLSETEDFDGSGPLAAHVRGVRQKATESNLRFWSWKDSKKSWEMVWKTELSHAPQTFNFGSSRTILDLAADPQDTKFYTLSEDYILKAWHPTRRLRSGIRVTNEEGYDVSDWTNQKIGVLPLPNKTGTPPSSGRIGLSKDGSLLLASISVDAEGVVGIFDTRSCNLLSVHFDKINGPVRGLGMIGTCAVVLSDVLAAWDLVDTGRKHKAALGNPGKKRAVSRPHFHLACDTARETIGIISPTIDEKSLLTVLTGRSLNPDAVINLPFLVVALLPAPSQRGFLAVSPDSEITLVTRSSDGYIVRPADEHQSFAPRHIGLDQVFGDIALHQPQSTTDAQAGRNVPSGERGAITMDNAGPHTTSQMGEADRLRQIFDSNQPLSSPAVLDTFRQVAAALSKKTNMPV